MTEQPGPKREEYAVSGNQLVDTIKDLLHEGNIRRIQVKQEGRIVLELPLTAVAVGVLIAPVVAALGAFAALATDCTIVVERDERAGGPPANL
ncbi:MAG: DUF4342 domain-containing protein [Chloroflexota bacterium]